MALFSPMPGPQWGSNEWELLLLPNFSRDGNKNLKNVDSISLTGYARWIDEYILFIQTKYSDLYSAFNFLLNF